MPPMKSVPHSFCHANDIWLNIMMLMCKNFPLLPKPDCTSSRIEQRHEHTFLMLEKTRLFLGLNHTPELVR
jgi:hypothetical protein